MSLKSLASIENWPVPTAAAGVVRAGGARPGPHRPARPPLPRATPPQPQPAR
ncbi:serine hydrolase, partial [Streptomyces albogriseolus]